MPAARAPRTTGTSGGYVCEDLDSLPLGGGSAALFCKGRGGRACPKSLAELKFADHEQDLDSVVNDRDERPPTPLSSSARVPARGLGDFFKFIFPSEGDLWREETADWLLESESLASALAGQGAGVQSYVRSLGVTLLLNEVADPRASNLDAEAAWLLVRSRALAVAATATDAAIQDWALSFCEPVVAFGVDVASAAVGKSGRCALITAKPLPPGGESFSEVLGDRWPVKDHGELLASASDATPERAKCLYLSVAAALKMDAAALLAALRSRARQFLAAVAPPKPGECVPEAILYAFELAHDLLERDHPQMRAAFLWFGDLVLSHTLLGFVVACGGGDFRVEFFKGTAYDASSGAAVLGFVECADCHARELVSGLSAVDLPAWEARVTEWTGVSPGRWYMSGFEHIVQKLRGCRGQHRMRDPATLYKCEICPSLSAPAIRVHPRRFIGAASAAGAVDARLDPLSVMVERSGLSKLVAESRVVLAEISLEREAASVAAAQSVLAGTPPPWFFSFDRFTRVCGQF